MTANEIRSSFLKFFENRGHRVVPSDPVIPHDDPTLLFTNAGMNQFKDVFLGTGKREYVRAADTQKCIRVSGKHNDLEEVGRDTYHHTFFEMLGNWSFGDYYKKEAIEWAWELLTKEWGLDKRRLYATVYETDDEAEQLWKKVTDIDPSHVMRFGKKDNFWEMGETGPCGPCSEIHIDFTNDFSGESLVNAGDPRVMEIWNLVFIQNNRNETGELEPLPAKHVDTGMGFERMCAVLQGKSSNYDTDVFIPIINAIAQSVGKPYSSKLDSQADIAMRVIADHIRMLTFAIADGAIPSNEGRGYVLRRILRRAARFGRNLGIHEPFIYKITQAVVDSMGKAFPEIVEKQEHVQKVIESEEVGFNATLDRGLQIFESVFERIGHSKVFPGEDAFKLYDTYGFPLDLTQLMAEERGLRVDVGEFTELMQEQKKRSKSAKSKWMASVGYGYVSENGNEVESRLRAQKEFEEQLSRRDFVYEEDTVETTVASALGEVLIKLASGEPAPGIFLEKTTFYCESGGQVSDAGYLALIRPDQSKSRIRVVGLSKSGNRTVHLLSPATPQQEIDTLIGSGCPVITNIDIPQRRNIERNHSATHLVHEALRRVLGTHVHQQGSLVAPDHLRFDFPHFGKITPEEIKAIEDMVNEKISYDIPVVTLNDPKDWLTIDEAKRRYPNVKMFFGEKYGEKVRIVEIDPNFSVELCGGTHVKSTRDIGLFKIISESSIASGVRRIEARSGEGIQLYIDEQLQKAKNIDDQLTRLIEEKETLERELNKYAPKAKTSTARPSLGAIRITNNQPETLSRIESVLKEHHTVVEQVGNDVADLKKELAKWKTKEAASGIDDLVARSVAVNGLKVVSSRIEASDLDQLKSLGDSLRLKLGSGVGVLASVIDEKVAFVCVVTDDLIKTKNLQAGKIVGEMAKQVGGGGGGKPHLATAGGKDISKLDEALQRTADIVRAMLSG